MYFLMKISLRNLTRQKKRNFFLGISMAFGVMILIVATSFSRGISDVIFNRVIRYATGQVSVAFYEKNMLWCQIFRDKEQMMARIKPDPKLILDIDENVGIFSRAIGNGKGENVMLIGVDTRKTVSETTRIEMEQSFKMIEGSFKDLQDEGVENPAILSDDKARDLNVKMNDVIRVRYKNIFGQQQAAKLTVVGIMKITNVFMSGVIFLELKDAKALFGYQPWEMGSLSLTLKNPKRDAIKVANSIHAVLEPGLARIMADAVSGDKIKPVTVLGFMNTQEAKQRILDHAAPVNLDKDALGKKGVILTAPLAAALNAAVGTPITIRYQNQFAGKTTKKDWPVTGIISPKDALADDVILLNEYLFYDTYYDDRPLNTAGGYVPAVSDPVYASLAPEWILLPRTKNTDAFKKKMRDITAKKTRAAVVDVATMYEIASDVLKMERALNIVTVVAVLILFFIILIGVVNTLRMTIRERTREIGTMRALGMQKGDLRNVFIMETLFLTLISSMFGIVLAFLAMRGISGIRMDTQDNPLGMFLVDGRIFFLHTWQEILMNIMLIAAIAVLTAYFPAKRAANLRVAEAFRHYE